MKGSVQLDVNPAVRVQLKGLVRTDNPMLGSNRQHYVIQSSLIQCGFGFGFEFGFRIRV
jgi:hypothetical protein